MERATEQLASITRGLTYASNQESTTDQEGFVHAYARVLDAGADGARVLGELHSSEDLRADEQLQDVVGRGRSAYEDIAQRAQGEDLDSADSWPIYGALQTDAHRLVEEFAQTRRELQQLLGVESEYEPSREG